MKKWTQFTIHPQTLLSGVLTQMSHGKKEQSSESLHTDFHQYLVCPPCARTTDSRRLLIPWMSLRIWFWGILFHSSCRAAVNSLRLWTGGSLCSHDGQESPTNVQWGWGPGSWQAMEFCQLHFAAKKIIYSMRPVRSSIVVHKYGPRCQRMVLKMRYHSPVKNLLLVTNTVKVATDGNDI